MENEKHMDERQRENYKPKKTHTQHVKVPRMNSEESKAEYNGIQKRWVRVGARGQPTGLIVCV